MGFNASTELICEKIKSVKLGEGEELISFDVVSLYTNVPVLEAIDVCTELLYSGNCYSSSTEEKPQNISQELYIKLRHHVQQCSPSGN